MEYRNKTFIHTFGERLVLKFYQNTSFKRFTPSQTYPLRFKEVYTFPNSLLSLRWALLTQISKSASIQRGLHLPKLIIINRLGDFYPHIMTASIQRGLYLPKLIIINRLGAFNPNYTPRIRCKSYMTFSKIR